MAFNGSGLFVIDSTGQPVSAGNTISASDHNALTADLAIGLSNCITKDGQTTVTGTIDFLDITADSLVVSENSTSAAVRITQVGTGNALLVEDSANPDSTPFVVDASGRVGVGHTSNYTLHNSITPHLQISGSNNSDASMAVGRWSNDASTGFLHFSKSRSTTIGTFGTIVQSGDPLGAVSFSADDGASAPIEGARIQASVDGTPGTNDMPGRLTFHTTADGASTISERMRIDNKGQVGIGASAGTGQTLTLGKDLTGATSAYGALSNGTIQSDVTSNGIGFGSSLSTDASSFTLANLHSFYVTQGTIGAGSTVTNQFGYSVSSNFTGGTNNYGFFSNIASGSNRYNFYANGTADNYFGGLVDISGSSAGQIKFPATQNASTNANTLDDYEEGTWTPSVGGTATYTTRSGTYTKIGRLVYVNFALTINVLGTGSASNISGLPFTVANTGVHKQGAAQFSNLAISVVHMNVQAQAGTTSLILIGATAAAASQSTLSALGNGATVQGTITYEVS